MNTKVLLIGVGVVIGGLLLWANVLEQNSSENYGQANVGAVFSGNDPIELSLPKLGGGTIDLADYRGEKPVILDFWASWCPNCKRDMPKLNAWYQEYKDKVEVIGINLQESSGTAQRFVDSRSITFPIALDPERIASRAFQIQYTNTHILISKEGQVIRVIPGDIRESDITSLFN